MSRASNLERIVTGVVRQAIIDADAAGVALRDDGSPEAILLVGWFDRAFGASFHRVGDGPDTWARIRHAAVEQGLLTASPINKTVLLLEPRPVPETLIPLGDLYASDVRAVAGGWQGTPIVHRMEALCGGIDVLDAALRARFEERHSLPDTLAKLPEPARAAFAEALERARFARGRAGLVPKLGTRTAGIDLFA